MEYTSKSRLSLSARGNTVSPPLVTSFKQTPMVMNLNKTAYDKYIFQKQMQFRKEINLNGEVTWRYLQKSACRSIPPEVFLRKCVLKTCTKFTGEHPYRREISIKFHSDFIEIAVRHGCSPVNLLHIFRTVFHKNTSG